ncbi:leucyl aminopeptidase [Simiduia agarivorans]|uniref:Probable cytosol aminopeptidase n=1 Tax=Simiduia agarivorans (strain DSM 21679 / JCM 13881 / BCRC 17597 / SA1) TaxID=1117647 RepID=K4KWM8_SIMAS|nr:leucyl aminopeptidase [Simiduia agarivorans]AFU98337.1 Leucyl aminopeptidase [Simiduia agarivorans SA1 = DSM 21679]
MKFTVSSADIIAQKTACLVIASFEDGASSTETAIDQATSGLLTALRKRKDFTGENGQTLLIPATNLSAERLLLVGLGKRKALTLDTLRKALAKLADSCKTLKAKDAVFALDGLEGINADATARALAQALTWSAYSYSTTKSKKPDTPALTKATFAINSGTHKKAVSQALDLGLAIGEGCNFTRELGNLPANICTPTYLADIAKSWAKSHDKLKTTVLDRKDMEKLGMGSLLSVAAGSDQPPKLIVMEYNGGKAGAKPVVLVGKGVTFDTGGISLKPGEAMDEMKFDMCGAASVFGAMHATLAMGLKINLVCIVPATENMPNGHATKPGDVVTSMSGQTIEVLNTDAEGRLILCDALTYAERFKPKCVVDVATLTGACVIALGHHATGLYANQQPLADKLLAAGVAAGDKAWQMPLWDEYQSQLDSNFADIANIGGRPGGSVTAACFLSRFTGKYQWAHLDIAGTAWKSGAAKGATGRPVPLLCQFLIDQA